MSKIPYHIGLIPDGNRRFTKKNKYSKLYTINYGWKKVRNFINFCIDYNIGMVSIYLISTENFKKRTDIIFMLNQLERILKEELKEKYFENKNIKVNFFGNRKSLSKSLLNQMKKIENKTNNNNGMKVNLLLDYDSKEEIINVVNKLIKLKKKLIKKNIDKNMLIDKPLDLIIRTGGYSRLSNFMLWNASYSEIFISKKLFPEFNKREFKKAIVFFSKIKRNFGI